MSNLKDVETSVEKFMKYNQLGVSDIHVSALSLGGAPFADSFYGPVPETTTKSIIDCAFKSGINYIDTAFWYGQGTSESAIGKALVGVPRKNYFIGTKIGRYFVERERMFDFTAERTLKQVDEALSRLQLPYVDIIQAHDVEFASSEDVVLNECLPALQKAKDAGKARYIGITGYPLSVLKSLIEKSTVKIDVVLSYCRGTMFDETLRDYIHFFESKGIGVINAAPTGMGLLAPQGPPSWHPADGRLKGLCQQARDIAGQKNVSIAKLAVKHSLSIPAHSTLVGANNVSMLEENIQTYRESLSATEQEVSNEILRVTGNGEKLLWGSATAPKKKK